MFSTQDEKPINSITTMPLLDTTSSKPKQDQQFINIAPKFPPIVDTIELISKKSPDGRIPSRAPNAFIIYRKVYVETARENGHYLPMTIVSAMASQSWESADESVKAEYRRIAREALRVRNEMYPKSGRRKRKDRWNIVSFDPDPPTPPPNKNDRRRKNVTSNSKKIKGVKNNKNNEFNNNTSPINFDTSSFNANSTPDLSFETFSNTIPMYTNNPSNPDLSASLFEKYLAKRDFNANNAFNDKNDFNVNNAFNDQTSSNLPIVNTPITSNIFASVPSAFQEINFQYDLNTEFTQGQTLLNESDLQFLNNSLYNENGINSSFAINQTIANTPFIQSNSYDMAQPLQFHNINEMGSNIINDNANYEILDLYCNDTMSYSYA
ncbi:23476_t:CDS:1 [Cetraspora pellucida]|uniref:23476_t:CDS:1 n=1 Tax=Cetraspora pellucida TaxID=1433469 RepID=A0A9N9GRE2_9GLOM|nr:23476_t:CDS:1 [Cetraspora pellucida]